MQLAIPLLMCCAWAELPQVQTKFLQVQPVQKDRKALQRSANIHRAVVLIHGFAYAGKDSEAARASLQGFQLPGSPLIQKLKNQADVFAFAYGQTVRVEQIAELPALRENVLRLKQLGYTDIVLLGHSAGGLVARHFVEDNPDAGVTRVVQVCAPNGGTLLAKLALVAPSQKGFVQSLTEEHRRDLLRLRAGKTIPQTVQCVCIMGTGLGGGDGAVSCRCQWPEDLQRQGIPVIRLEMLHFLVMDSREGAACMAEAVLRDQPRWTPAQVEKARKQIRPGGVLLMQ